MSLFLTKSCFLAGLFLCPYTSPIAKETDFGITLKDSEQEEGVLIVIPGSIMKLQSVALSIACISLTSVGFGFSLVMPQRANAMTIPNEPTIYGEYLPRVGLNLNLLA